MRTTITIADDVNLFRLNLIESGASISNRNRIMTGVKFLLRVALESTILRLRSIALKSCHQAAAVRSIFRCDNSAIWLLSTGYAKIT